MENSGNDIISIIFREHNEQRELMNRYEQEEKIEVRHQIALQLVHDMSVHAGTIHDHLRR